jgi:hypothetical protein
MMTPSDVSTSALQLKKTGVSGPTLNGQSRTEDLRSAQRLLKRGRLGLFSLGRFRRRQHRQVSCMAKLAMPAVLDI